MMKWISQNSPRENIFFGGCLILKNSLKAEIEISEIKEFIWAFRINWWKVFILFASIEQGNFFNKFFVVFWQEFWHEEEKGNFCWIFLLLKRKNSFEEEESSIFFLIPEGFFFLLNFHHNLNNLSQISFSTRNCEIKLKNIWKFQLWLIELDFE